MYWSWCGVRMRRGAGAVGAVDFGLTAVCLSLLTMCVDDPSCQGSPSGRGGARKWADATDGWRRLALQTEALVKLRLSGCRSRAKRHRRRTTTTTNFKLPEVTQ
ncbi:uncharacterized protein B0I36DRAFT_94697 [Microdochium trichocladiopsis]|uniref:Uncharacterized protein n=1 Tax=Microdochium trichocladiopsis TaxID=1682393 RepID=A0A9P8Y9P3_9PEZI|nr:uncharacterized protein B0I36DRAFT_94697 [Microdochium trichocladiopsis]KAH7035614.1 hypothetical protein B0I36DRAFT_94697 [Microdochium trichocladiopsis]